MDLFGLPLPCFVVCCFLLLLWNRRIRRTLIHTRTAIELLCDRAWYDQTEREPHSAMMHSEWQFSSSVAWCAKKSTYKSFNSIYWCLLSGSSICGRFCCSPRGEKPNKQWKKNQMQIKHNRMQQKQKARAHTQSFYISNHCFASSSRSHQ